MKIIIYILSLFIMVLTAVPCIDKPLDNSLNASQQSKDTPSNHPTENDHCSPFCTCQCCASPIVFQYYMTAFKCFTYSQKHFSFYSSAYTSSFNTNIWQPPKLS